MQGSRSLQRKGKSAGSTCVLLAAEHPWHAHLSLKARRAAAPVFVPLLSVTKSDCALLEFKACPVPHAQTWPPAPPPLSSRLSRGCRSVGCPQGMSDLKRPRPPPGPPAPACRLSCRRRRPAAGPLQGPCRRGALAEANGPHVGSARHLPADLCHACECCHAGAIVLAHQVLASQRAPAACTAQSACQAGGGWTRAPGLPPSARVKSIQILTNYFHVDTGILSTEDSQQYLIDHYSRCAAAAAAPQLPFRGLQRRRACVRRRRSALGCRGAAAPLHRPAIKFGLVRQACPDPCVARQTLLRCAAHLPPHAGAGIPSPAPPTFSKSCRWISAGHLPSPATPQLRTTIQPSCCERTTLSSAPLPPALTACACSAAAAAPVARSARARKSRDLSPAAAGIQMNPTAANTPVSGPGPTQGTPVPAPMATSSIASTAAMETPPGPLAGSRGMCAAQGARA